MRRSKRSAALLTAALAAVTAVALAAPTPALATDTPSEALSTSGPCGTMSATDGKAHAITHVIWVVFENKSRSRVFKDPTVDPYLTGLAAACGQASQYQSTPASAAKLAMTSGIDWGAIGDPGSLPGPNLYSQLDGRWLQYMGDMPANCSFANTETYYVRHNPAAYYVDAAAACATQDQPLPADPAALDLSQPFTYIEGNVPDSMHGCDTCPLTSSDQLGVGDKWASTWVTAITSTDQYRSGNTVVFLVWDEGGPGGTVPENSAFLVLSPYTTPGSVSDTIYSHYSLLRGTEDLLGLDPLGHAGDATTPSVADDFQLPFPAVAGPPPSGPLVWSAQPAPPVILPPIDGAS